MKRVLVLCVAFLAAASRLAGDEGNGSLERIRQTGVLRWGADPSGGAPFVFNDPKEPRKYIGFEVEIAEAIARRLGSRLGVPVRAEMVAAPWDNLIPNLNERRDIDLVLNGLEITAERGQVVRFTVPYFSYSQQLTVLASDRNRVRTLADLKGQPISILEGSASERVLEKADWPNKLINKQDDSLKPYEQLENGRVKAVLAESIIASHYAGKNPKLFNVPNVLEPGNYVFSPGTYAGAVRRGPDDEALLFALDRALEDMKSDGELASIYQRWGIYGPRQEQLGVMPSAAHSQEVADSDAAWGKVFLLLLEGAGMTLLLTLISMPLALLFGLVLALMTRSGRPWLQWPAAAYIQVIRGTPLLVQIYVIYFSLPKLGELLGLGGLLTWHAFAVGVLCLSANYAAYEAEIHRAGLDAVPRGQREAALALGMTEAQTFWYIVLPQSFRIILPPVVNDLVSMLKDSCLVSIMGVNELLRAAESTGKSTFHYAEMLLLAAVLYFLLSLACDRVGKHLEERLKTRGVAPLETVPVHH